MKSMQRPRVAFHMFETYKRHPGKDGANHAYTELANHIRSWEELEARPHDFIEICSSDEAARAALKDCDVVVATVGPHAQMYFYLRERLGLNFRIVRDTKTALWNGYLQQEMLAAPYLRSDDVLVSDSRYSQGLFNALFPHLRGTSQGIAYPIFCAFPPSMEGTWTGSDKRGPRRLGFVGRLTTDKNYPDALALLAELRKRHGGKWELHAIGEQKPERGARKRPASAPVAVDGLRQFPPVSPEAVWPHYRQFDALFFPSTSTCETFGRVMAEAAFVGTPIIASEHGATSEVLEEESLVATRYRAGVPFTTHFGAPLADVDVQQAADKLVDGRVPTSNTYRRCADQLARLRAVIHRGPEGWGAEGTSTPTRHQQAFLDRIRMEGLAAETSGAEADRKNARLRKAFVSLHRRGRPQYLSTAMTLLARSPHRQKTLEFLRHSLLRGEDFTYIGGIDLQQSHLIDSEPRFRIAE